VAQIRKRGPSQYQARVRLKGHPEVTRTFSSRQDALAWATEQERLLLQGLGAAIRGADQLTLYEALERYATDVTRQSEATSKNSLGCVDGSNIRLQTSHCQAYVLLTSRGSATLGKSKAQGQIPFVWTLPWFPMCSKLLVKTGAWKH
jgi:hypothetical protein